MRSLLIFRNGEWLRNSTLNWRFPISENVRQIHSSPSVKLRKNTKFIASYPAPGKYQWIACSPERFFQFSRARERGIFQAFSHRITNGECHENMMFVDCFPAPRKRYCIACFPEHFTQVFPSARSLYFPSVFLAELPMVNAMKTWCLSIVFLLHENAIV